MYKFMLSLLLLAGPISYAQKPKRLVNAPSPTVIQVPMTPEAWSFKPGKAEITEHKGVRALKILPNTEPVGLNNVLFDNGTIEFDVEPQDPRFMGIYFRRKDAGESEYLYLRVVPATTNPLAADAIQYAPYQKGVLIWDLLPQFQGPARVKAGEWNHVKLIVSGQQMRVYVNDMDQPVLHVPRLEADVRSGGIAFEGAALVSRVVIRAGAVEEVPSREGYDPTHNDPRYLRRWQMTQPMPLPVGQELQPSATPKPETSWSAIEAERQGLVNLTRLFGISEDRRVVWLKTRLTSKTAQKALLRLGFSDEVWVFVNGQPVFMDKNLYRIPTMRKAPDGRISIENATVPLPLKAGENELLIGLANNFFGWGLIARLDELAGIEAVH